MKVLFVAPWPPSEVRPRSLGLLRLLSESHDVHVVALCADDRELSALRRLGAKVTAVANPRTRAVLRASQAGVVGRSLQVAYGDVPALRDAVMRIAAAWRPDVLHLNVLRTAHLRKWSSAPTVVDLDEFRSLYYRQLLEATSWRYRLVGRHEAAAMNRVEQELINEDVDVLVSGESDRAHAQSHSRARIHLVRTPVWGPGGMHAEAGGGHQRVLFVGRLSYEANVTALERFATEVWPSVLSAHPGVTLEVVGARPHRRVVHLARRPGIELHADVESVVPYYLRATLSIVPIERGTGVQMKLIEAFAARVPVVASELAARLAGADEGRELLVARSPGEWADAVGALLTDEALRADLRTRAFGWYDEKHSPGAVANQLASVYEAIRS